MSEFNGRRAPNVSAYINSLNTISPPRELGADDDDFLNFSNTDLDMFTNAEFFELSMDVANQTSGGIVAQPQPMAYTSSPVEAFPASDFQFNDFSGFNAGLDIKPAQPHHNIPITSQASPIAGSPLSPTNQVKVGEKRKADFATDQANLQLEESSRHAAEEDKRRRNTAASARFRVKKKQREQALEKSAKEMSEKVALLEAENQRLKMENKWLKGIIVEKEGKSVDGEVKRIVNIETEDNETRKAAHTKGVGTAN